jgi:hypothetical protein
MFSSVDLEKAIRLQQGQMTYKFERLGMCWVACTYRIQSEIYNMLSCKVLLITSNQFLSMIVIIE